MPLLNIETKEDSLQKVEQLTGVDSKLYIKAEEFNSTIDAINNLDARVSETSNKLTVDAGFEIDGTNFQLNQGNKWEISGAEKTNAEPIIKPITLSNNGMIRQCIVLLNSENDFYFKYGQQHPTSPPKPTIDAGTVELTVFPVTESDVGTPEVPVVNGDYITKSSRRDNFNGATGENVLLPEPNDRVGYRLIGAGLISIDGILYGGGFGSTITVGDLFPITNVTGNSVVLNHSSYFITDNYVLPNERVAVFRYEGNGIYRLIGNIQSEINTEDLLSQNAGNAAVLDEQGKIFVPGSSGIKGFHRFSSPNFAPAANTNYYFGGQALGLTATAQVSNTYVRTSAMATGFVKKVSFYASAGLSATIGANIYLENITKGTSLTVATNFQWFNITSVNLISNPGLAVEIGDFLTFRVKIGGDGTGGGGGTNNNFWAEITIE